MTAGKLLDILTRSHAVTIRTHGGVYTHCRVGKVETDGRLVRWWTPDGQAYYSVDAARVDVRNVTPLKDGKVWPSIDIVR